MQAEAPPRKAKPRKLVVAGLFSGIGGLELGLNLAGHESGLLCELDPAANAVLNDRFPGVQRHSDVTKLRALPSTTELVAAGFPCQDLSQAGKTAGITGKASGLVGEVFRLLRKRPVEWVLIENVPFMLQLAGGRAIDLITSSLERLSYKWAYRVVDSRSFGVPQRRERVYLVASLHGDPRSVLFADEVLPILPKESFPDVACGFYWTEGVRGLGWAVDAVPTLKGGSTIGIPSQPAIILPNGLVGKPDIRDAERLQGFEADWTLPAESIVKKGHRWKLIGNAVTVSVANWIGRRLALPGKSLPFEVLPFPSAGRWPRVAWNVGEGRFSGQLSSWPESHPLPHLTEFLDYPVDFLSSKATAGFLGRTRTARLRFPPGFLDAVSGHLKQAHGLERMRNLQRANESSQLRLPFQEMLSSK